MIDDNNIIFVCPKCQENFSLRELLQHDTVAFTSYVDELVKEETRVSLDKELKVYKTQSELLMNEKLKMQADEFRRQNEELKEKYHQDLKQLETELNEEKSNLKVLQANQESEIGRKIAETENKYAQEINELQTTIKDKIVIIDSQTKEMTEKLNEIKSSDEIEYLNLKAEIEKEHNLVLSHLQDELGQEKSKLKLFETQKQLEIETQINSTKDQFGQQISELNLAIQTKQLEMESKIKEVIYQKETEYLEQKTLLETKHAEEVAKLRLDLEKNKVFSNKIKGENFEQEVESELRKGFGDRDRIEKITLGETKADYLQIIKVNNLEIGKIVYEVKNAKWSDNWLAKFASDVAKQKTKYGILVTTSFNEKYKGDISFIKSDEYENIWIADPWSFIFVAQVVRKLIEIENGFAEREKELVSTEESEIIKQYKNQILKLREYLDYDLPDFLKSFRTQLNNLEGVKNSLHRNANRLERTRDVLRRKFDKLVKTKLESITGRVIVESQGANYVDETIEPVVESENISELAN